MSNHQAGQFACWVVAQIRFLKYKSVIGFGVFWGVLISMSTIIRAVMSDQNSIRISLLPNQSHRKMPSKYEQIYQKSTTCQDSNLYGKSAVCGVLVDDEWHDKP